MITESNYNYLKEHYGNVASWAIWQFPGITPKSNVGDITVFDKTDLLKQLNPDYVFVALNGSGVHNEFMDFSRPWHNFHSGSPYGNDFKLRYALKDTPYWGAYITDIIKNIQEKDSNKVQAILRQNPEVEINNLEVFEDEIIHLGKNPTIIALGESAYKLLKKHLGNKYRIIKMLHYSCRISKENYRNEFINIMQLNDDRQVTPLDKKVNLFYNCTNTSTVRTVRYDLQFEELYESRKKELGLDCPKNWVGDIRSKLIFFFSSILISGNYYLTPNTTDSSKPIIDLYYKGETHRRMGFYSKRDMTFVAFATRDFYEFLCGVQKMPAPNPQKTQPHFKLTLPELWNILCNAEKTEG